MSEPVWSSEEREHRDVVKLVRDCLAGERRIKQAGERYLPRSEGMSAKEYGAMKARASYLNAPRSLRDTLMGRIFRKPGVFNLAGLEKRGPWWNGGYHSWDALARAVMSEVLSVGRIALLVDPSPRPTETQILVFYDEDIVRTRKDQTGQLEEVVLKRSDGKLLTLSVESGVYTVQIEQEEPEVASTTGARPRDFIPIVFITPSGLTPEAEYPPLADLALKSIAHYQLYAEYRQALHYVATPQPFVAGFAANEVPTVIGPSTIWKAANPDAKVQFVSYEGNGLAELRTACETLKVEMASQGASMLVQREGSNIAARTVELRQREDTTLVIAAIHAVNDGLTMAASYMMGWEGIEGEPMCRLNMDLVDEVLDAPRLKALHEIYLSGSISWDTFIEVLKRGDVVPAERSAADELALIESDPRTLNLPRHDHDHRALP